MEMTVLDAKETRRRLCNCIREYDEFHWAVAWGSWNDTSRLLLKHSAKFRTVIFGVSFSQTHPDLIDALKGVRNAYVANQFTGGTFHPKLYCFRSGSRAAVIIGSANFTNGGLDRNNECGIYLVGDTSAPAFAELFDVVAANRLHCQSITGEFAEAYRRSYERAQCLPKSPRNPFAEGEGASLKAAVSPLAQMSWSEFTDEVEGSSRHDLAGSMELLRIAQRWFSSVSSFSQLTRQQWKAIAGTLGDYEKEAGTELDRDWGWFGSMKGAGDFANRVEARDPYLAKAVDSIPRQGDVTRAHYDQFVANFIRAFENSHRVGRVATASRLLAMKRPDTFLCVSGPNIVRAAKAMDFARTTLSLDNYWDRVVEAIRISEWYNCDRPASREQGQLWDFRAAMLDAIYYDPRK